MHLKQKTWEDCSACDNASRLEDMHLYRGGRMSQNARNSTFLLLAKKNLLFLFSKEES